MSDDDRPHFTVEEWREIDLITKGLRRYLKRANKLGLTLFGFGSSSLRYVSYDGVHYQVGFVGETNVDAGDQTSDVKLYAKEPTHE